MTLANRIVCRCMFKFDFTFLTQYATSINAVVCRDGDSGPVEGPRTAVLFSERVVEQSLYENC